MISMALDTQVLVSSNKDHALLERLDPDRRSTACVPEDVLKGAVAASDAPRFFESLLTSQRQIVPQS